MQLPEPPAQFEKPESEIRDAPMRTTTPPVTMGVKIFLRILGLIKAKPIRVKLHKAEVPSR